jgi:hypothetical protein
MKGETPPGHVEEGKEEYEISLYISLVSGFAGTFSAGL